MLEFVIFVCTGLIVYWFSRTLLLLKGSPQDGLASVLVHNFGLAVASAILALVFFAVGFGFGGSRQPIPPSVTAVLSTAGTGIAALGFWDGWRWTKFPWPAVALTSVLLAAIFSLFGETGLGLNLGVMASAVLLFGGLIARGLKRLRSFQRLS